jgi:hypothetical protein
MNLALLLALGVLRTYVHPTCGYSFQVPAGYWVKATTADPRTKCEVQVRPINDDSDDRTVWVDGGEGSFATAVERSGFAEVSKFIQEKTKGTKPALGIYIAYQPDGSWKEARPIERRSLAGLRIDNLALDCTDGGRLEPARASCPGDLAFLGNGHRWANVTGPVKSAAFESILNSLAIPLPPMQTYVHPRCHYSFRHLASWVVTPVDDGSCEVQLRPMDFAKRMAREHVDRYTISVDAGEGDFDTAAEESDLIQVTEEMALNGELKVGSWLALGRGAAKETPKEFARAGLRGLRVDSLDVGCHFEQGGYAGLCPTAMAFLTDGKRYVRAGGHPSLAYDDVIGSMTLLR